jgi:hypothetical protein
MRAKCNLPIIVLLWVTPVLPAYSTEEAPLVEQEREICAANGTIDLDRARKLRDLISEQNSSSEGLLQLRSNLDESISRCYSALNAAHAAFFASSYVDIAAKLFSIQRYDEALISYRAAESLFVRFLQPNVLWPQALQGEALSELSLGNKGSAEQIASNQSALVRKWVREKSFSAQELHHALLFQADLCEKSGNTTCSQNIRKEVKDLDASARR